MREYKIIKSDLWYNVYRKKEEDWLTTVEWLQNGGYSQNRQFARTFYHVSEATSALVVEKAKLWKKDTTSEKKSEPERKVERQSWSEF